MSASITAEQEAELLRVRLVAWAEPRGGQVKVMQNQRHLWEEVLNMAAADMPRLLVCWTGEDARGGFNNQDDIHRVDRGWKVIVMRGHGFEENVNTPVETPAEVNQVPIISSSFIKNVEDIRDVIRAADDISEEHPVNYRSIKPLPNAGPGQVANTCMDSYEINFTTANDIPLVTDQDAE